MKASLSLFEDERDDFIKAERNLEAIGFFTPSKKSLRSQKEKVIQFKKRVDGQLREMTITIIPSGRYGLPNTVHQDFYRAFQRILTERIRREGGVPRKISFSSAELLAHMGEPRKRMSGKRYRQIDEWLHVMRLTGIEALQEGVIWQAKERRWVKRLVTVFDDVVSAGTRVSDGRVAEKHEVTLSQWQYDNISKHYLLSMNYEAYRQLKRGLSKALFSLLHSWFFVGNGIYTKRYDELCQFVGLKEHAYLSLVKKQLDPANSELQEQGFVRKWKYEGKGDGLTITWYAGEAYLSDKRRLKAKRELGRSDRSSKRNRFGKEARAVVRYFHQELGRAERQSTELELEKAQEWIVGFGAEAVQHVVDYALREAERTDFRMRDFGAVKLYWDDGLSEYQRGVTVIAQEKAEQRGREQQARQGAVELVERLHSRIGRMDHRPQRSEIEDAIRFIERNGLRNARRIVDSVVEDARDIDFEIEHFGQVEEVMDRAVEAGH